MPHQLPSLAYTFAALEPYIDAQTMELHYTKHHQTYIDKLNAALSEYPALQSLTAEELLTQFSTLPEGVREAVRNHAGGHANHSLLWATLTPQSTVPADPFRQVVVDAFGSHNAMQEKLATAALSVFGSGWAWLVVREGKLVVETTPNQDSPLLTGGVPIFGIDVWEHAYYLKYQNRRTDYVRALWSVVHWEQVGRNYSARIV